MSADVIPFPTGLERAAARGRHQLTQGREHLLTELRPHITHEHLRLGTVAAYFRVEPWRIDALAAEHRTELAEAGYRPDIGFSRRAILHIALLLPLKVSERADVVKRALGDWAARQPAFSAPTVIPSHEVMCRRILNTAAELAEDTQDGDPHAVWAQVSCMDRHTLQGVAVALAAMLPLDQSGLRGYLTQIGLVALRDRGETAHPSRGAAAGLSTLVPEPKPGN